MSIAVLMSTFNGERFIAEQIDSILGQLPENGILAVRDDGSTDSTVSRIEAVGDRRITLLRGDNIGYSRSFLTLLAATGPEHDLVMFSDQDDVWLPGKIERARQHLQPLATRPALYCSAQMLVDEDLRPLQRTPRWPRPPSFTNALCENIVTGCSAALNRPAVTLLQAAGAPAGVRFHDWWLYLVVSAFGTVVVDDEPTLLYRQHGKNQIGHGAGRLGRQLQILRFLRRHDWIGILLGQLAAFDRHYGPRLGRESRAMLRDHFDFADTRATPRLGLLLGWRRWRQTVSGEILFRALLAAYMLHLWPLPGRKS